MLKKYSDPKAFWNEVYPHLRSAQSQNNLILGLAYAFRSEPSDCLYQSALFGADQKGALFLRGALLCSRQVTALNLIPSAATDEVSAKQLFAAFQEHSEEHRIALTGLVAESETAGTYRRLLHEAGMKTKVSSDQGIYRCRKVRAPEWWWKGGAERMKGIRFRAAQLKDVDHLGEWVSLFQREALPYEPPVNGTQFAEGKVRKKLLYVIERDGELLSMAGWSRDIGTACSINLVFTPKNLRRNGFAALVTAKLTHSRLIQGREETNLYTDMSNPTSNRIYREIGYEYVCGSTCLAVSR